MEIEEVREMRYKKGQRGNIERADNARQKHEGSIADVVSKSGMKSPRRKSGRPAGSKNTKPIPKVNVLVPMHVDIDEILRQNPEFTVTKKRILNGRWDYEALKLSSGSLDRNILLWMLSRIAFFETTIKDVESGDELAEATTENNLSMNDVSEELDEVTELGSVNSEAADRDYAPISRRFWLDRIRDVYVNHRAFLEHAGVIEIDHSYSYKFDDIWDDGCDCTDDSEEYSDDEWANGEADEYSVTQIQSSGPNPKQKGKKSRKSRRKLESKSKGYRVARKYQSAPVWTEIEIKIPNKVKPHLPFHLTDDFFKDVVFDYNEAHDFVISLGYEGMSRRDYRSMFHMAYSVSKLQKKDFTTRRDLTSFRANNVVTHASKKLRRYLTYKGKKLYAVDLSNSQPLFLSILLQFLFFNTSNNIIERSEAAGMGGHISVTENKSADFPSKTKVVKTLRQLKLIDAEGNIQNQMLERDASDKNCVTKYSDVEAFFQFCISGQMYEHLMQIHNAKRRSKKLNRDQMKDKFIIFLFAPKDSHNETIRSILKTHFPNVLRMMEHIKSLRHNTLAILLQCLESHLFLDVVARQLHESEAVPFCTLHDSIITTEENIETVKRVIMGAFEKEFGVRPNLKWECWQGKDSGTLRESQETTIFDEATNALDAKRSSFTEAPTQFEAGIVHEVESKISTQNTVSENTTLEKMVTGTEAQKLTVDESQSMLDIDIEMEDVPDDREGLDEMVSVLNGELRKARMDRDKENIARLVRMIDVLQKRFLVKKLSFGQSHEAEQAKHRSLHSPAELEEMLKHVPLTVSAYLQA